MMQKAYNPISWVNDETPINADNLNKMDIALDELDNRVLGLETTKFDKSTANTMFDKLFIKNTASGETIHLTDSADSKVLEFGLHGKAEQNGTPTPDAPVDIEVAGASGSVEVKSVGKNLAKFESGTLDTSTGLEVNATNRLRTQYIEIKPHTNYIATNGLLVVKNGVAYDENKQYITAGAFPNVSTNILNVSRENAKYVRLVYGLPDNSEVNPDVDYGYQLEEGTTPTEYQPYKESTSLISTPDGEDVKYADGSGKRIQRTSIKIFDHTAEWLISASGNFIYLSNAMNECKVDSRAKQANLLSNYSYTQSYNDIANASVDYGVGISDVGSVLLRIKECETLEDYLAYLSATPLQIVAERTTEPIITDLTAEEIAEIEKLHTFYPVTNISNDAGCGMAVTYLADSKNYIDNQLALQAQAQEEALLNMLLLMPDSVQASMIENDTNNLLNEAEV